MLGAVHELPDAGSWHRSLSSAASTLHASAHHSVVPSPQVRGTDPSLDDEALEITIERQSREARAYNTGLFYDPTAEVDGGAGSADGEQRVVVSLSNGQTAELPLWLLQHMVLAQNGELEAEHDGSSEGENGDDEGEMAELKVNA